MKEFIEKLSRRQDLSTDEASSAMRTIMEGGATDAQIAGFLIALKFKGEHPDELLGFVRVMEEKSLKVRVEDPDAIDMCGTGGDGSGTFNISTVASFVVAGTGVTVAKHGNRSISSSCGSADVLRSLGVRIDILPEKVETAINTVGIGFLFAPLFHPAMKHAAKSRMELGVKTAFNLLGPMTNPAGVRRQLVGAFDHDAADKVAAVFTARGMKKCFVVSSEDGLDEISLDAPTLIREVNGNTEVVQSEFHPAPNGFRRIPKSSVQGGDAETNARIAMAILRGEIMPHRDYVVVNAAYGLLVAGAAPSLPEAVGLANESIDSGRALAKLEHLIEWTNA